MRVSIDCTDDNDKEYNVEASVSRVVPARLSGPPEDCYPAEGGEIEDHEVWEIINGKRERIDYSDFLNKPGINSDHIDERLAEAAQDDGDYDDCDDYDDDRMDCFD